MPNPTFVGHPQRTRSRGGNRDRRECSSQGTFRRGPRGVAMILRTHTRHPMKILEGQTVGIDLGTTYSAIAQLDRRRQSRCRCPTPMASRSLRRSCCWAKTARSSSAPRSSGCRWKTPRHIVEAIKRQMGNKDFFVVYQGKKLTPEFISALILKKLKQDAEKHDRPDRQRGDHRAVLLQRRPPQGDAGRRPHRRAERHRHHQRADRRHAGLRLAEGRTRPRRPGQQGTDDPGVRPGRRHVRRHRRAVHADALPRAGDRRRRDAGRPRLEPPHRRSRRRAVPAQVQRRSARRSRNDDDAHPGMRGRQARAEHEGADADQRATTRARA